MYKVVTFNLGPDGRRGSTSAASKEMDRGQLTASELTELLEAFKEIDVVENADLDPHIVVISPEVRLILRTSRKRILVYDGHGQSAPAAEMTIPEIFRRLDRTPESEPEGKPRLSPTSSTSPPIVPSAPHRLIAIVMLLVGLALNGYILYSVFYVESVNKKVDVVLITDADEVKARSAALAGVYATGPHTGDRVIEIEAAGGIRFYEIGAAGPINENRDTYRLGRHDGTLCLSTPESGIVDLAGDTLVYYRDVYQRRRASP